MTALNAGSDADVLSNVFASDRDRRAEPAALEERAPPAVSPPVEPAKPDAPKEPTPEQQPSLKARDDIGRFTPQMPVSAHTAEREKWQEKTATETRLREEAERRADDYRRRSDEQAQRLEAVERRMQAAQNPPQPPPDPLVDPEGAFRYQQNEFQQQMLNERLNTSEMLTRAKHGDQIVDEALNAAKRAGAIGHFIKQPNCYAALVTWYADQKVRAEVGTDLNAYRDKLKTSMRQEILDELKKGAVQGQPPPHFPGSLADATSSGNQGQQSISDEALLSNVFASNRKRR